MRAAILCLSFLSGIAGLFYESVWTRYLGLLVGHDAYAQVMVLVIFLGGMSAGAYLLSRWTTRIARPLMVYGAVEAAVGIIGLFFHDIFLVAASVAYDSLFPALAGTAFLPLARWLLPAMLILPQSVLLGATFPLITAAVLRHYPDRPGNTLAWVYFTNSLGGAIGVLLAGFVVLRLAGLPGVTTAAGTINLVVGLLAFIIARTRARAPAAPAEPATVAQVPTYAAASPIPLSRLQPLLLGVAFGTAVASFAYEIDWIRMLALVLGSATHAFELMLSAFILGLAIGAITVRKLDGLASPLRTLGWVQVAMGILAVLTLPVYVASFGWIEALMSAVARTDPGYTGFSVLRYGLCLVVMLPATICAGMTLPLITRSLMVAGVGEAAIGRVYAWNTFGAIVGVSVSALVLLPGLGLKSMLLAAGALDIGLGLAIFAALRLMTPLTSGATAAVVMLGAVALLVPLDRALLTSGVFRTGSTAWRDRSTIEYYADGRTATVAVASGAEGGKWISTNGKPDASLGPWWDESCTPGMAVRRLGGDEITQAFLPLVTAAYHPTARTAAVIGFGSGMSSHLLLALPTLEELTTIEIEPRMVEGARHFLPANRRVYDDPRSRVVIGDAKAHFTSTGQRWDLILSEPSNPWVSGVSGLFTVEFYARVRATLSEGGVFGQWLHTYQLNDALVMSVLAAIDEIFPSWTLHQVGPGDLLVVASSSPQMPRMNAASVLAAPSLQEDLCRFAPFTAEDLGALSLASAELLRPVLRLVGQPNSDYYPILDLGAERARFRQEAATGVLTLGTDWWNLSQALSGADPSRPAAMSRPFEDIGRVRMGWAAGQAVGADPAADYDALNARWVVQQWNTLRDADTAPVIWAGWLDAMANANRIIHGGHAGVADTAFFDRTTLAARRLGAPEAVLSVIDLRRAAVTWDSPLATSAIRTLDSLDALGGLIPIGEAMDAVVVLALRAGDVETARKWFRELAPRSGRDPGDLRVILLGARLGAP